MEIAPLLAMRGFPLSRSGGEMHWRIPGEESVSIRGNMWYSHYRGEGGDAIFQRYRGWWWAVKCAANV